MDWLRRTIFGTPTTVNSPPQQSDDAQDEAPTSDTTASGPGTSPRGSPSDGDSEVSSNRSRRTTPQHSERMVRKRRSLPRLKTSGEPSPTSVSEPGKAGSTSESRQAGLTSKTQKVDTIPETGEDESTSESRQVDSTSKSEKVDSTSKAPKTDLTSETREDDLTSEARRADWTSEARNGGSTSEAQQDALASDPQQADLIIQSSKANIVDPAAPQVALEPTSRDALPSATQEAIDDGVMIPKTPDNFGEQPRRSYSLAELYTAQHGREPPPDFAEYMKQAEDNQMVLMHKVLEMSRTVHEEKPPNYDEEIHRRDLEIEALRKEIEETTSGKESLEPAPSVPDIQTPIDKVQISDVLAPRRQQLETQKTDETEYQRSKTGKEMRQLLIDMILARAEVAQIYKEWESMASLAAAALDESSDLIPGHYKARSFFYRGVALYKLHLYWEAETTFENSRHHTEDQADRVEVDSWLEKAKQAQIAAQSALSMQSSVFAPSPMRSRTDSIPVVGTPNALKNELDFDSDFDSIRGFGSRTPSVQSLLASAVESPLEQRQPRSAERGPAVRDPRLRESSLNRRIPGRQMYSPMRRTPDTPRIPSPLNPQRTFTDTLTSELNKQRPIPSRMASTGTKSSDRQRGLLDQVGQWSQNQGRSPSSPLAQSFQNQGRPLSSPLAQSLQNQRRPPYSPLAQSFQNQGRPPSSPLARRPDTHHHHQGGIGNRKRSGSESLRHSTLLRNATTADARRQSLRGNEARTQAAIPRRHSALIQEIKFGSNEADLNPVDEASEASGDHVRDQKRPESKEDMQTELDGLLGDSRSDKGEKSMEKPPIIRDQLYHDAKQLADRLQIIADQQEESISPGTVAGGKPVFDDEFPFRGGEDHTKKYATPPVQYDHHSEEAAQEKKGLNGATGEQRERSGLQAELEKNGEDIPQEAFEFNRENTEQLSTQPEAGTTGQAQTNDRTSDAGDQNTTIAEDPVKKGGPDDLYDVEDDYVAPTPGPASGVFTPVTETEEDLGDENVEWELVPREAKVSTLPTEPLNMAEGAASHGLEMDMLQEREQDAKVPAETLDEEQVAEEDNAELLAGGVGEEEPARQEGAINESKGTSEAKKDGEEMNQRRESGGSPISSEGKGNNSKKTKKRKKKGKR